MKRLLVLALLSLVVSSPASSHNRPYTEHNRRHAITYAWCHSLKPCAAGNKALSVAYCESGPNLWPYARNGQYLGMFQMGEYARSTYGHSWSPWWQAVYAHQYWLDDGWAPWECA